MCVCRERQQEVGGCADVELVSSVQCHLEDEIMVGLNIFYWSIQKDHGCGLIMFLLEIKVDGSPSLCLARFAGGKREGCYSE